MFAERTLAAGATEDWLVAYDLTTTPVAGQTFAVSIPSGTSVVARGAERPAAAGAGRAGRG
jgi:hypothetical protein